MLITGSRAAVLAALVTVVVTVWSVTEAGQCYYQIIDWERRHLLATCTDRQFQHIRTSLRGDQLVYNESSSEKEDRQIPIPTEKYQVTALHLIFTEDFNLDNLKYFRFDPVKDRRLGFRFRHITDLAVYSTSSIILPYVIAHLQFFDQIRQLRLLGFRLTADELDFICHIKSLRSLVLTEVPERHRNDQSDDRNRRTENQTTSGDDKEHLERDLCPQSIDITYVGSAEAQQFLAASQQAQMHARLYRRPAPPALSDGIRKMIISIYLWQIVAKRPVNYDQLLMAVRDYLLAVVLFSRYTQIERNDTRMKPSGLTLSLISARHAVSSVKEKFKRMLRHIDLGFSSVIHISILNNSRGLLTSLFFFVYKANYRKELVPEPSSSCTIQVSEEPAAVLAQLAPNIETGTPTSSPSSWSQPSVTFADTDPAPSLTLSRTLRRSSSAYPLGSDSGSGPYLSVIPGMIKTVEVNCLTSSESDADTALLEPSPSSPAEWATALKQTLHFRVWSPLKRSLSDGRISNAFSDSLSIPTTISPRHRRLRRMVSDRDAEVTIQEIDETEQESGPIIQDQVPPPTPTATTSSATDQTESISVSPSSELPSSNFDHALRQQSSNGHVIACITAGFAILLFVIITKFTLCSRSASDEEFHTQRFELMRQIDQFANAKRQQQGLPLVSTDMVDFASMPHCSYVPA